MAGWVRALCHIYAYSEWPPIFFRTGWVRSGVWPVFRCPRVLSTKLGRRGCALPMVACMGLGAAERRGAPLVQGMAPWLN